MYTLSDRGKHLTFRTVGNEYLFVLTVKNENGEFYRYGMQLPKEQVNYIFKNLEKELKHVNDTETA